MSRRGQAKSGWLRTALEWVFVGGIVGALIAVYFAHFYFVPTLTYERFQPYRLSEKEQITMIVIANEGRSAATNVRVRIEVTGEIKEYRHDSLEVVTPTKEGKNVVIFDAKRLIHGTQITVFIVVETGERSPVRDISITSDQGTGQEKAAPAPVSEFVSYIALGCLVFVCVSFLILDRMSRKTLDKAYERWLDTESKLRDALAEARRLQQELDQTHAELKDLRRRQSGVK